MSTNANDQGMKLNGKVVIITGVGRPGHIGYAIARRFLEEGSHITIADVEADGVESIAKDLASEFNTEVLFSAGDLSVEANFKEVVDKTMKKWGRLDVLVNNAGGGIILPFLDHTPETLVQTLNRNLWTTIWGCRLAIPIMKEQGIGSIVNIGAESVRNGLYNHAGYNAAKGGVHGLTTGLAREFAPFNIRINTVAPSGTRTETVKKLQGERMETHRKAVSMIPMGRPAMPEEVAEVVAFLGSGRSSFITGQVISVNGGSSML